MLVTGIQRQIYEAAFKAAMAKMPPGPAFKAFCARARTLIDGLRSARRAGRLAPLAAADLGRRIVEALAGSSARSTPVAGRIATRTMKDATP